MSDSTTLVAYLEKQWGTVSWVMCSLAQETVSWAELHSVTSSVRYIPVKKSIRLSYPEEVLPTEWSFLPQVFDAFYKAVTFIWTCLLVEKREASFVCVSGSRSHGMEARCFSTSMEQSKCLFVSPCLSVCVCIRVITFELLDLLT